MTKAVFVDVDGTLTTSASSWERAHQYFARTKPYILDEMKKSTKMFFGGEIDYNTWAIRDVALWKGMPYDDLKNALLPPEMITGAVEGIDLLKKSGYHVFLVSGGINVLVNEVAKIVNADGARSNGIGQTKGVIDGTVDIEVGNSKVPSLHILAETHQLDLSKSLAIGDNVNDLEMFREVGYSLAINPKKEIVVQTASDHIQTNNFLDAVKMTLERISKIGS